MWHRSRQHEIEDGSRAVKVAGGRGSFAIGFLLVAIGVAATSPRPDEIGRPASRFDADAHVDTVLHRACANCHSNETQWPWYGKVSPIAWLIRHDVMKAREHLNLSEQAVLSANQREEIYDAVADHSMPPRAYVFFHPEARLSPEDLATLSSWSK